MQNVIIILLIIIAVVAMVFGGWVSFSNVDDSATMTIHKKEVKQDTEEAVQKGAELIEKATDQGRKLIDQDENSQSPQTDSESSKQVETPRKP